MTTLSVPDHDRSHRSSIDLDQHPGKSEAEIRAEKYRLAVSAGPSYDESTHVPVLVNGPTPHGCIPFENKWMKGSLRVRIRSYTGLPNRAPTSCPAYFEHPSRSREQYSISFSFVPKVDLPATTAIWGNDFDHPVRDRLPPGFNIAVGLVKMWVDPTIELDAYADEPWMYAPALACFFAFRIGERRGVEGWGSGELVQEDDGPLLEGSDGE
jgi:hypothetical protein